MDYFTALGITPEAVAYAWSWGFGSVASMYFLGYTAAAIKTAISKI